MATTPSTIITQTACAYGLAPSDITSRSMRRRVADARAVAAYLAYELTGASYSEIAAAFGGRRRQTIHRSVERVDQAIRRGLPLASRAMAVERLLEVAGEPEHADTIAAAHR